MTYATGVPVSACFSANAICSSVYLDFFMSQLLARRLYRARKLSLKLDEKTGGASAPRFPRIRFVVAIHDMQVRPLSANKFG